MSSLLVWKRCLLLSACMMGLGPSLVWAQTTPSFEVATVRPSDPNKPGHSLMMSDDKLEVQAQTLKRLVMFAYGFASEQQVTGGPGWLGSAQFDMEAKEDQATVVRQKKISRDASLNEFRAMLRELLAERFRLKVHHESRELPVHALTIAKGGLKIAPVVEEMSQGPAADATAKKLNRGSGIQMDGRGNMEGINTTTENLAQVLGREPEVGGRLVQDKTGLTGKYNFKMKWARDAGMNDGGATAEGAGVSLFTALQEQLGLKLEATKGSVDVVVIDSVEMPTEN